MWISIQLKIQQLSFSLIVFLLSFFLFSTSVFGDTIINLDNGAKVFEVNCAGCHINGGNIVRRGKNLKLKALHKNQVDTQQAIASLVANGKGNMSAYQERLTNQEINDVSAYVLFQAQQNWQ